MTYWETKRKRKDRVLLMNLRHVVHIVNHLVFPKSVLLEHRNKYLDGIVAITKNYRN